MEGAWIAIPVMLVNIIEHAHLYPVVAYKNDGGSHSTTLSPTR